MEGVGGRMAGGWMEWWWWVGCGGSRVDGCKGVVVEGKFYVLSDDVMGPYLALPSREPSPHRPETKRNPFSRAALNL